MSQRHSIQQIHKVALLGASRGLGFSLFKKLQLLNPQIQFLLVSRKITSTFKNNELNKGEIQNTGINTSNTHRSKVNLNHQNKSELNKDELSKCEVNNYTLLDCDFSKLENTEPLCKSLKDFKPDLIFYVAGGGPYGLYTKKEWKDHIWAYNVNLLFPAKLYHELSQPLAQSNNPIRKMIFIGSQIAGVKPDPLSSSYASAKHGLRGLISSLQKENVSNSTSSHSLEPILFSPGYMDTSMLPPQASPRLNHPEQVESPDKVATVLLESILKLD